MLKRPNKAGLDAQLFAAVHGRGFLSGLTLMLVAGLCLWLNQRYFHIRLFNADGRLVVAVVLAWAYCFGVVAASTIWFGLRFVQAGIRAFATLISRKPPAGLFLTPLQLDASIRRFAAIVTLLILVLTLPLSVLFLAEVLQGRVLMSR